jgi:arabinan endo-1,5-alpha-L-arabinosidase
MKKSLLALFMTFLISAQIGCFGGESPQSSSSEDISSVESTISSEVRATHYTNPVFEPVLADPHIIKDDDGYFYVFGTQDDGKWGDDYGVRYVPIIRSLDLVNWEYVGQAFTLAKRPSWGTIGAGIWAPDIAKVGDTYNLYYSLSTWGDPNPGIGVATAPHPSGPWTDRGMVLRSSMIGVNNSIDPTVFVAEGKVYMIWGSFRGLYGVELTSDGLALKDGENAINTKVHIAGYDTSRGWDGSTYEGAYVIYKDGFYYMFTSSGTCCEGYRSSYHVKVSRSTSPLGPYYDSQGRDMLSGNRGHLVLDKNEHFIGPGHNSIVIDDAGDYWILYHAFDVREPEKYGNSPRRCMLIDKLVWDDQGWPSVEGLSPSHGEQTAPYIEVGGKK